MMDFNDDDGDVVSDRQGILLCLLLVHHSIASFDLTVVESSSLQVVEFLGIYEWFDYISIISFDPIISRVEG